MRIFYFILALSFFINTYAQTTLNPISTDVCQGKDIVLNITFDASTSQPWLLVYSRDGVYDTVKNVVINPFEIRHTSPSVGIHTYDLVSINGVNVISSPIQVNVHSKPILGTINSDIGPICAGQLINPPFGLFSGGVWTINSIPAILPKVAIGYEDGSYLRYEVNDAYCGLITSNSVKLIIHDIPEYRLLENIGEDEITITCNSSTSDFAISTYNNGNNDTNNYYQWYFGNIPVNPMGDSQRLAIWAYDFSHAYPNIKEPISVDVTNACGTRKFDSIMILDSTMYVPTNPNFPARTPPNNNIFPLTVAETFIEPTINYPAPYYFVSTDNITYPVGSNMDIYIPYLGNTYNCIIANTITSVIGTNRTIFLDRGTHALPAQGGMADNTRRDLHIVGAYDGVDKPIIQITSSTSGSNSTFAFYTRVVFENFIIDGNNQGYGKYFMRIAKQYHNSTDGLILKNLNIRNIGSGAGAFDKQNGFLDILDNLSPPIRNESDIARRYLINVNFESANYTSSFYSPININTTDGLYFKGITIGYNPSPNIAAIHISHAYSTTTAPLSDTLGCKNIIFDWPLNIPIGNFIDIGRYNARRISFPIDFRYVALPINYTGARSTTAPPIVVRNTPPTNTEFNNTTYTYYDLFEDVYLVKPNSTSNSGTNQLNKLKTLINNAKINYECTLPDLDIKMLGLTNGGFTVSDFGDRIVNIAFIDTITTYYSQNNLIPFNGSPIILDSLNAHRIKLHNMDYSSFYHLQNAIKNGDNLITNSTKSTFYNSRFKEYRNSGTLFTINTKSYDTTIFATICYGQTYNFKGQEFSTTGIYYDSLQTVGGCDSIIVLNLTVNQPIITNISATIDCNETYTENGFNVENHSGIYALYLVSSTGCDSIVYLDLHVNPGYESYTYVNICPGETYDYNGTPVNQEGLYTIFYENEFGCDSIINVYLTVNNPAVTNISAEICQGEYYTLNGFNTNTPGLNTLNLQTYKGCDSTVNLTTNTPGLNTLNLQTIQGCDSTVNLNLTVNPLPRIALGDTLVFYNGQQVEEITLTGDVPGALYKWFGEMSPIFDYMDSGMNVLPSFVATNNGPELFSSLYSVTSSYTYLNKTCYDTSNFTVIIIPTPSFILDPSHQTVCHDKMIEPISLTGTSSMINTTYRFNLVSGDVANPSDYSGIVFPTSGYGLIWGLAFQNYGISPNEIVYSVTPIYEYNGVESVGESQIFSITVNPLAVTNLTGEICQGEYYTLNGFNTNTPGLNTLNLQ
ncbi:MAG: hypothetical protein H6Q16_1051, partial [Bacteroidetes bacterium]|nr:hypothetical protein [Bacteroidota bacterium]